FSTASDNQTSVEVHVLQGERPMASDNRTLGKFHLVGIPPAPRVMPLVEVTFDIDANVMVNVSAKDMGTGREQKITITASSGLSKDEIDKMMREAEAHAGEDARKKEEIEARNRLDSLVYQIEKTFAENKEKLDGATQTQVETAMADAKKALEEGGVERMNNAFNDLQTASHKLAESLYQSGGAGAQGGGGDEQANAAGASAGTTGGSGTAGGGDDNVIDAEYVDVDENK
ncbi:MAG: molecular chaperone DnaK, partial [Acidobacteriota bacterium]|nr:molecular chaperone DnaK [Acidobacteriota bacterium]